MQDFMNQTYIHRGIQIILTPCIPALTQDQEKERAWKWYLRIPLENGNTVCLDLIGWSGFDPLLGTVNSRTGRTATKEEAISKAKTAIDYIIAHSPDRVRSSQIPSGSNKTDE